MCRSSFFVVEMPAARFLRILRLGVVLWATLANLSVAFGDNSPLARRSPIMPSSIPGDEPFRQTESFESASPGEFKALRTAVGVWRPEQGRTIIDNQHAKSGRQCLQLTGGKKTSVVLDLSGQADPAGELSFWAERWTSRSPFTFRIEKKSGGDWEEIYNGDREIRVGRAFLSRVQIPLKDKSIRQLRLSCSSPLNTGILIDDFRIAPAKPQAIVDVDVVPFTLPALVGAERSSLLKLRIKTSGTLNPLSLTRLEGRILGQGNLQSLFVSKGNHQEELPLPLVTGESGASQWNPQPIELADGENIVWLRCQLKSDANVDDRVGFALKGIAFSNGKRLDLNATSEQRLGVALRKGGDDGVHTFRIPGLVTTNKGTLIGVYDVRRSNGGDLPGNIDVGMSRSTDGGRSWEPMRVIMDMGDDPNWRYDGIGDPAVLVDSGTGTIWVAATWSHGNRSWVGSGPGLEPEETGQLMLVRSDDDGLTWSKPINITRQIKRPEWSFLLQGPGKGITMRDGTIVFAAQYQDPPNRNDRRAHRLPHSTIIYSRDHGKSWQIGTGAWDDTTEAQVVELEMGTLMLNCRYNRKSARVVMTTRDMGRTWQKHPTSEVALIEPRACMASLINADHEVGKDLGGWLLFSNPNSLNGRKNITIKASADGGATWLEQNSVLLDEGIGAGYSCMSMIDSETIGILYEGSQAHMTFQRVPLAELISGDQKYDWRSNR